MSKSKIAYDPSVPVSNFGLSAHLFVSIRRRHFKSKLYVRTETCQLSIFDKLISRTKLRLEKNEPLQNGVIIFLAKSERQAFDVTT